MRSEISCDYLPSVCVQMDGSTFFFFSSKDPFGEIASPFALSCPVAKNSEVYKANFSAHAADVQTAIFI